MASSTKHRARREVRTPAEAREVLRAVEPGLERLGGARLLCVERAPEELYIQGARYGAELRSLASCEGLDQVVAETLPHVVVVGGVEPGLRDHVARQLSPFPLPVVYFGATPGEADAARARELLVLLDRASRVERWLRASGEGAEGVFTASAVHLHSLPIWFQRAKGRLDVTLFGREDAWAELVFEQQRLQAATVRHRRSRAARWEQGPWSWPRLMAELAPKRLVLQHTPPSSTDAPGDERPSGIRTRVDRG